MRRAVGDMLIRHNGALWEVNIAVPYRDQYGDWTDDTTEHLSLGLTRRAAIRRARRALKDVEARRDRDEATGRYAWQPVDDPEDGES